MRKIRDGIILLLLGMSVTLVACSSKGSRQQLEAEVAPALYDRDCIVTIISDDGYFESGKMLNKLAQDYDMHVTVAGVVNFLEEHKEEWKEIEKGGNVELISHSYAHTKMSEEANLESDVLKHEILDSVEYYQKNFTTSPIAFIPPENTMCAEGYELLKEAGIYAIRQGGRGLNSLSPEEGTDGGQWYNLLTHGIADVETTEERNRWVDDAINEKAWLIEMWHNVTEEGKEAGYQAISAPVAEEHVAYISEKEQEEKVWIASMTDATKYIYEKENAKVNAVYDGRKITVKLECELEGKNKSEFDFPLTVKIKLPEELNEIGNFQVKNKQIEAREQDGNRYIYVELTPNTSCKIMCE